MNFKFNLKTMSMGLNKKIKKQILMIVLNNNFDFPYCYYN